MTCKDQAQEDAYRGPFRHWSLERRKRPLSQTDELPGQQQSSFNGELTNLKRTCLSMEAQKEGEKRTKEGMCSGREVWMWMSKEYLVHPGEPL